MAPKAILWLIVVAFNASTQKNSEHSDQPPLLALWVLGVAASDRVFYSGHTVKILLRVVVD